MNKNWKAIATIPCKYLKWSISLLEISSDFGQKMIRQMPEYFTEEAQPGPYPLSLMKRVANEYAGFEFESDQALILHHACPDWMPTFRFFTDNEDINDIGEPLPEGIDPDAKVGATVYWEGNPFIVIESDRLSCNVFGITPAEFVDVDC